MSTFHFDLIVTADLTGDADTDRLFALFEGGVTPAVSSGTPLLMCSIEAESFPAAVTETVRRLRESGVDVQTVQAEPDAVVA